MTSAPTVSSPTLILQQTLAKFASLFKFGAILRLTSLSILFAGSSAIVFAAVTLVKVAEAKGVPVSTAATANAPIFLYFSKVVAVATMALLIAEALDSFSTRRFSKFKLAQYIATTFCCLCAFNFAFVVSPEMEHLLPYIQSSTGVQEAFHSLHETSRLLFGGIILFSWLSLIFPVFHNEDFITMSAKASKVEKPGDKTKQKA